LASVSVPAQKQVTRMMDLAPIVEYYHQPERLEKLLYRLETCVGLSHIMS